MKSVLISIQPKWCELIASGKKTVEVRKTKPKLETPFKVYIYCTKGRGDCLWRWNGIWYDTQDPNHRPNRLDGKVIGEFVCDKIINIPYIMPYDSEDTSHPMRIDFIHETCVPDWEIDEYLGRKDGYGWHISDLVIYEEPRELGEFKRWVDRSKGQIYHEDMLYLQRPPQSWCYVERSANGT